MSGTAGCQLHYGSARLLGILHDTNKVFLLRLDNLNSNAAAVTLFLSARTPRITVVPAAWANIKFYCNVEEEILFVFMYRRR